MAAVGEMATMEEKAAVILPVCRERQLKESLWVSVVKWITEQSGKDDILLES